MPTSGPTLRIERQRSDITVTALAAQMHLSRQALWALERAVKVSPGRVEAYRDAIKRLRESTDGVGAA